MAQAALCDITPQTRMPMLLIFFCVHVLLLVGRCEFRPNRARTVRAPCDNAPFRGLYPLKLDIPFSRLGGVKNFR